MTRPYWLGDVCFCGHPLEDEDRGICSRCDQMLRDAGQGCPASEDDHKGPAGMTIRNTRRAA